LWLGLDTFGNKTKADAMIGKSRQFWFEKQEKLK
jgi:hypothetical protein